MKAETLLESRAVLGEGPVWDERRAVLYWVDIDGKKLHQYTPLDGKDRVMNMEQRPSAVFLTGGSDILLALEDGIHRLRPDGTSEVFAYTPEKDIAESRLNDGKCDSRGRIWVGSMDMCCRAGQGALYRIGKDGQCSRMLDKVTISNGLCWSPGDQYLYYIDTPSEMLWRFDFDIEKGLLSNRTGIIDYSGERGSFDGMTIDSAGNVWIAQWGGFQVSCWDPSTGKKLEVIEVPAPNVTCCTFGGAEMDQLFITTAAGEGGPGRDEYPHAGNVFVCRPGITGCYTQRFGGY
ncbi:MAG: SMP-30/gluconolactonase/LRE family protein [Treponema sp.]|jgi:sugar lactone lactonase YvrE|nr:SMP-30/gluconolactonase/LRE family protein [Treponema sp.]